MNWDDPNFKSSIGTLGAKQTLNISGQKIRNKIIQLDKNIRTFRAFSIHHGNSSYELFFSFDC